MSPFRARGRASRSSRLIRSNSAKPSREAVSVSWRSTSPTLLADLYDSASGSAGTSTAVTNLLGVFVAQQCAPGSLLSSNPKRNMSMKRHLENNSNPSGPTCWQREAHSACLRVETQTAKSISFLTVSSSLHPCRVQRTAKPYESHLPLTMSKSRVTISASFSRRCRISQ